MTPSPPPLIEVLIPTLNEAEHISQTVANALTLGPVLVLDSFSTDGTQQLARAAGATVVEHQFVNYASQKNWALEQAGLTAPWVFILDADERITPALRDEVLARIGNGPEIGFYVNRLLIFMGQTVRHGGLYPSWNLRLFKRGSARYEPRAVHEHVVCDGPTAFLIAEMLHIRRESMTRYLEKHIRYADLESDEWVKRRLGESTGAPAASLFRSHLRYRQWLRRQIWPRLPLRPLWRFIWMYFLRLGFLDGRAGWHLARLMASYEYMITLLYKEKMARVETTMTKPETGTKPD
jgi:glycosyltransferase involved in cell wall biosynthesis